MMTGRLLAIVLCALLTLGLGLAAPAIAAERAALAGKWAALMLSYEAAPAFDRVFAVHPPGDAAGGEVTGHLAWPPHGGWLDGVRAGAIRPEGR